MTPPPNVCFIKTTVWVTDIGPTHFQTRKPGPVLLGNLDLNRSLVWDPYLGTWTNTWEHILAYVLKSWPNISDSYGMLQPQNNISERVSTHFLLVACLAWNHGFVKPKQLALVYVEALQVRIFFVTEFPKMLTKINQMLPIMQSFNINYMSYIFRVEQWNKILNFVAFGIFNNWNTWYYRIPFAHCLAK